MNIKRFLNSFRKKRITKNLFVIEGIFTGNVHKGGRSYRRSEGSVQL